MSFTAMSAKTAGVDSISSAELANLEANIAWLRKRPSMMIHRETVSNSAQSVSHATWTDIIYNEALETGDQYHTEWADPAMSTSWIPSHDDGGGDSVEAQVSVESVETGVWEVGGYFGIQKHATGRRLARITLNSATTITIKSFDASGSRASAFSLTTLYPFLTTSDDYAITVYQDSSTTLNTQEPPHLPARWWARWVADSTNYQHAFSTARATSATDPVTWWNQMRLNLLRLNSRPLARVRLASNQSINDSTWTAATFDTLVEETDGDMVDATEDTIVVQQAGVYKVSWGIDLSIPSTTAEARTRITIDGVRKDRSLHTSVGTSGSTYQTGHWVGRLEANEAVGLDVWHNYGSARNLQAGHGTYLAVQLLAGDTGAISADSEVADWAASSGGLSDALPVHANMNPSGRIPLGYMNVLSDAADFLYSPTMIKRRGRWSDNIESRNGDWVKIPLNRTGLDPHNLTGANSGVSVVTSTGGIRVPHGGLWDLTGWVEIDDEDIEGDAQGATGTRGIRITVNDIPIARQFDQARGAGNDLWADSTSEHWVLEAGDEIELEVFTETTDGAALTINSATLAATWLGDGYTRTLA